MFIYLLRVPSTAGLITDCSSSGWAKGNGEAIWLLKKCVYIKKR